ncbi:hypothetical protein ANOM_004765, partial [Aspergillus nomiae NRRL 13137]
ASTFLLRSSHWSFHPINFRSFSRFSNQRLCLCFSLDFCLHTPQTKCLRTRNSPSRRCPATTPRRIFTWSFTIRSTTAPLSSMSTPVVRKSCSTLVVRMPPRLSRTLVTVTRLARSWTVSSSVTSSACPATLLPVLMPRLLPTPLPAPALPASVLASTPSFSSVVPSPTVLTST